MENPDSNNHTLETKSWKVYYLAAIFIASSLIQWVLLVNLECFEFLLNDWLLFGAFLTFLLIAIVCVVTDFMDKTVPPPLCWILGIIVVEIINISISVTIVRVSSNFLLYCSLAVIVICLVMILGIGNKINLHYLPVLVLVVFSLNTLFFLLISILMIVARFYASLYSGVFLTIAAICFPILIMNTLYISMLIHYGRYVIETLTDSLKPALHIHALFGSFVWFSLSVSIEIRGMMEF